MKTFNQLDTRERELALEEALKRLLESIVLGQSVFRHNKSLGERIAAALQKAKDMHALWSASDFILETCQEDLKDIAKLDAERALYQEPGDLVISLF